jgi:hypothetical protein
LHSKELESPTKTAICLCSTIYYMSRAKARQVYISSKSLRRSLLFPVGLYTKAFGVFGAATSYVAACGSDKTMGQKKVNKIVFPRKNSM